ncbi:MAG: sporulation transcription factor Spo0A [Firmicutes bacterium]|nr:sporulation transcription factor Spo0A [Bacillota bacterium]
MRTIKIGIADDNQEFCELLRDYFQNKIKMELVVVVHNGIDAIKALRQTKLDVLLLDLIMPKMDGLGVLQWLRDNQEVERPKIIIFSAFGQEEITKNALQLGVDYYILKPFDLDLLAKRIMEIVKGNDETDRLYRKSMEYHGVEAEVVETMKRLMIPPHFKGFIYLRDAIMLTILEPNIINEVTKKLYPVIADHYNTTLNRVERAMRFAIETAWSKSDVQKLNELFGYSVDDQKGKPTNTSFIATIADRVRLEKKKNGLSI